MQLLYLCRCGLFHKHMCPGTVYCKFLQIKKRGEPYALPAVFIENIVVRFLRNYNFLRTCSNFNHIESARECYLVVAAYCRYASYESSACGIYIG